MKIINFIKAFLNYILDGFGFTDIGDFKVSAFCFMKSGKLWFLSASFSTFLSYISTVSEDMFGVSLSFLIAYSILIFFEWLTGIMASAKKGEKHSSRKLGRMLFKISVYAVPIYVFNMFSKEVNFPEISGYEIDPFTWMYWTVIIVIIWQLFVSVLENLESLNVLYAKMLLKIINRKFYKKFDIEKNKEKK